jgi:hypothetical protein
MADTPVIGTNVYQDIAAADAYMANSIRGAVKWDALTDTVKSQCLITATRIFDRQPWQGTKTDEAPTQVLEWPREDVYDRKGNLVDSATVPDGIKFGSIEFAYDLSQDPTLETSAGQGSNIKKLKAGSAELEYFKGTGGPNGEGSVRFGPEVQEYIGQYLESAYGVSTGNAYGTDGEGSFDDDESYPVVGGFY